jgi:predicted Zn-dependent protease
MSQSSSRKPLQKVLIFGSGFAFIASAIFGLASTFNQPQQDASQTQNAESARITQLKQQEQGFASVLKREPSNQTALQGIVQIKSELKDYKGAIPYFENALKKEPNNQIVLQGIADLKLQSKDFKGAIPHVEKLVKLNPDKPTYKALLDTVKKEADKK